jgi:hypothetical protein
VLAAVRATIAPATANFSNWCVIVESPSLGAQVIP